MIRELVSILASTRYSSKKGFQWVGKEAGGTFKTLDFVKNGKGIQLKTFNGKSLNISGLSKTMDKMKRLEGTTIQTEGFGQIKITSSKLEIGYKTGIDMKSVTGYDKLKNLAKNKGVELEFFEIKAK